LFAMYVKVVFGKLGLVCWHNPPYGLVISQVLLFRLSCLLSP
jgi:hypothetical protein